MFRLIFSVIILILALSFFGISIQSIVTSPAGQENFAYVHTVLVQIWERLVGFFQQVFH